MDGCDRSEESLDAIEWRSAPDWEERLAHTGGIDLSAWRRWGLLHVVKQGPHRAVFRVDLPEPVGPLYLKHYRCRGVRGLLSHALKRSTAAREWRQAHELRRRHISTFAPVALGQHRSGALARDSYLLSEAIPAAIPLDEFAHSVLPTCSESQRGGLRREIERQLAQLVVRLHQTGVEHGDFHPGNILVQDAAQDSQHLEGQRLRLFVIDLPYVSVRRPLGRRRSMANLVMLGCAMLPFSTKRERYRFLLRYLRARGDLPPPESARRVALRLEGLCLDRARRLMQSRDRRATTNNRDFRTLQLAATKAYGVCDFSAEALRTIALEPEQPIRAGIANPLKLTRDSVVVKSVLCYGGYLQHVAYKRYRPKSVWKRLIAPWRATAGRSAWRAGHALLARGIRTPRPLVLIERGRWPRLAYLATEWVAGGENLHLYLWRLAEQSTAVRRRRASELARSLGELIGRLHHWHIAHRDLKACNLMVVDKAARLETLVIDLGGVRFVRNLSARRRVRDLSRLAVSLDLHPWVSRSDRMRFWRAYLEASGLAGKAGRRLIPRILHDAEMRRARFRRRGRAAA